MVRYSDAFKTQMVGKLLSTQGLTAVELGDKVGVHPKTLSRWLRESGSAPAMHGDKDFKRTASRTSVSRRPQDWSVDERMEVILHAARIKDEELGEFLRKRGLHSATLDQWRQSMTQSLKDAQSRKSRDAGQRKTIKRLERELRRKDKALAEAAALLVLQKRVQDIWGDEDDELGSRSEK